MRVFLARLAKGSLALIAVAGLLGCKKDIDSGASAFQSASPEIKKGWDSAMAAMQTNGYAAAILQLMELQRSTGITLEQKKAVDNSINRINEQMYESVNRDEEAGKAAIEELRKATGR
jgi:hypothetical protein